MLDNRDSGAQMSAINTDMADGELAETTLISPWRAMYRISKLALPMTASFTFSFSMLSIGLMSGRLKGKGENYLSATPFIVPMIYALAWPPQMALSSIRYCAEISYGELSNLVNVDEIREKQLLIAHSYHSGVVLIVPLSLIPCVSMYFSKYILTDWFKQNSDVAELAQKFLRIYAIAVPLTLLRTCAEQIMFASANTVLPMTIGLLNFAIGTIVAAILAFGSAKMGLKGIAIGYVIDAGLNAIFFNLSLLFHKDYRKIPFFKNFKLTEFRNLRKRFVPLLLQSTTTVFCGLLVSLLNGGLGKDALASLDFAFQVVYIACLPMLAFGFSTALEVGRLLGMDDVQKASRIAHWGLLTSVLWVLPFCMTVAIYPRFIVLITSRYASHETLELIETLVPIAAAGMVLNTIGHNMVEVLRSAQDLYKPTYITIASLWFISIGIGAVLRYKTDLGVNALTLAWAISEGVSILGNIASWRIKTTSDYLQTVSLGAQEQSPQPPSWWSTCKACFFGCGSTDPRFSVRNGMSVTSNLRYGTV